MADELAKQAAPEKKLAINDDYFKKYLNLGTEEIDTSDLIAPVLKVIQKLSKDVAADGRAFPEGQYLYTGDQEAQKEVDVTFLSFTKKQTPTYADKQIMETSYVFFGVMHPNLLPFRMFFRSTGIGSAKRFLTDFKRVKRPMFTLKVHLSTEKIDGEKGTYYRPVFKILGVIDNMETILKLEQLTLTYGETIKSQPIEEGETPPWDEK